MAKQSSTRNYFNKNFEEVRKAIKILKRNGFTAKLKHFKKFSKIELTIKII